MKEITVLKKKTLSSNQLRGMHFYNLSHCFPFNPLNRHYSFLFHNFYKNNVDAQNTCFDVSNKFCQDCGSIFIPGLTSRCRIKFPKHLKNKKNKKINIKNNSSPNSKKHVVLKCLVCKSKSRNAETLLDSHNYIFKNNDNVKQSENQISNLTKNLTNSNMKTQKHSNSKAKNRMKIRNKMKLENVVCVKEKESDIFNSLNLFDFMK